MDAPAGPPGGLERLFEALSAEGARYAVFGAVALALHGLPRATADVDLFVEPAAENVERIKRALRRLWDDPAIEDIRAEDLCGAYPAVRYQPPSGPALDLVARLGDAYRWEDLEIEERPFGSVRAVPVVSVRTLWRMKRDTVRPRDRWDAAMLAERFQLGEDDR